MKTAIYTVLFGGYDNLLPINTPRGVQAFVFTDDKDLRVKGWTTVPMDIPNVKKQREIKILAHKYLPNHERTIYVDANFNIKPNFFSLVNFHKEDQLVITQHLKRTNLEQEVKECIKVGKVDSKESTEQLIKYGNVKGMWATGCLIRQNTPEVREFCEIWNKEVQARSHRDQLSVGYALEKGQVNYTEIPYRRLYMFARPMPHKEIKVFYSSPFRRDKNLGKAYNDFINLLPNDGWVCLTDADSMFMLPDYGVQVEDIIKRHGKEYHLIGATTNRLGGLHQCYNNKFSEDMDVRNHYEIAKELKEEHGTEVIPTSGAAGFFMLFSKRTWLIAGGFEERTITADTKFNNAVRKRGGKIGLAKGLYLFHSYRLWETGHKKAWNSVKHLR